MPAGDHSMCDKNVFTMYVQVQFGIFPDDFTFNLLIDSYIKDGDFKSKTLKLVLIQAFDL